MNIKYQCDSFMGKSPEVNYRTSCLLSSTTFSPLAAACAIASSRARIRCIKPALLFLRNCSNGSLTLIPTPLYMSIFSRTSPCWIGSTMPCSLAPRPAPPQPEQHQHHHFTCNAHSVSTVTFSYTQSIVHSCKIYLF